MNSKHLSELVNFVCEITYKNEGIVLVDELFHVMLQLIELWNWAKEKEQLLNDLIRHYVIKHSHCKNPEHIDYLCKSLIKHEKDVIIVVDVENRFHYESHLFYILKSHNIPNYILLIEFVLVSNIYIKELRSLFCCTNI